MCREGAAQRDRTSTGTTGSASRCGLPVLASARLFRRVQALECLAEGDREAIIKVIDAMVVKHRTRQMVEEISS